MVQVINCGQASLPRSVDVNVTVSKPQTELTTDLSVAVFVASSGGFDFGAGRIGFYSTYASVASDPRVSGEGLKAARDFFAQPRRARQMAIAQVFTAPQRGRLTTGLIGPLASWQAVTAGSVAVTIDGLSRTLSGLNFSAATSLANVASILQAAIVAAGSTGTTVTLTNGTLVISSPSTGDDSMVSVLAPTGAGVDISGPGLANGRLGTAVPQAGYTPGDLVSELDLIAEATRCGGRFVYGYALDRAYRDTQDQIDAAAWIQARTATSAMVSNSPLAWDPSSVNDLAPEVRERGMYRVSPFFHDNPEYYPDMGWLAILLSVNYGLRDSTLTMKFKNLVGIPTVGVTETQWSVLNAKGYNTFTLTGNNSRTIREGGTGDVSWWADDVTNLDNFVEQLQVAVYNVFLRNAKVPPTSTGQALLQDGMQGVCERFVLNGSFAARTVVDNTEPSGFRDEPAYLITQESLALLTVADRAARRAPPVTITVNLTGAIHSIDIAVNAY